MTLSTYLTSARVAVIIFLPPANVDRTRRFFFPLKKSVLIQMGIKSEMSNALFWVEDDL